MSLPDSTSPQITAQLGIQLVLCIGIPLVALPILACAIYFPVRAYLKRRASKRAAIDAEVGESVALNDLSDSFAASKPLTEPELVPALKTNSVHVPLVRQSAIGCAL